MVTLLSRITQQDMESVPEKYLTIEEKTKLKERLALLKKEYKKTVHRLQKSQRAERVKTHVKKTIEEQNRLLSQEVSNHDSVSVFTGSLIDTNNVAGKVLESQNVSTPSAEKERKPAVSFNLDPEILQGDKTSPTYSGSESSGQEPSADSKIEATASSTPNQCRRSRLRLNRSARRVCTESMSPSVQTNITVNSLQKNIIEAASTRGSTPFTKDLTENKAPTINVTTINSNNSISEKTKYVQVSPECDLRVNVLVQQHNNTEAIKAPASPVFKKEAVRTPVNVSSENRERLYPEEKETLDTGQSGEVTTHRSHTGIEAAHSNRNNRDHLVGDQLPSMMKGASQDRSVDLRPIPQDAETSSTSPPSSEDHSVATVKYHGAPPLVDVERSPLDSCTLVEGLLFPVEYYVRTTRRMTSFQRKVDLEAVIHSHLGTARKGRQRRASISATPSLQVSDTPVSTSRNSAARSRRGRGRKSCPASVSSSLHNISVQLKFGSDPNPIADDSRGVKETFEVKELSIEPNAENLHMKEGEKKVEAVTLQSEGRKVHDLRAYEDGSLGIHSSTNDTEEIQRPVYNLRTSRETNETSSPFHLLSAQIHLQHLLRHLDITDFHLPDEDFGVLKLEKLKSANHLETSVPEPSEEKIKYRRACSIDSSVTPACDSSALLHGAAEDCTATRINSKLMTFSKDCPNGDRSQAPSGDNIPGPIEADGDDKGAPQSFLSMETPVVFRLSPSKDNDETYAPGTHCEAPQCSADWETTYSDAEVSKYVSQAPLRSLDPEPDTSAPNANSIEPRREGFVVSSTCMTSSPKINPSPETKPPPNALSPTKELSVLLSTSMCSVPLDPHVECVPSGCTPGFPMLGATPAVFSSPQCCSSPAPCKERMSARTIQFLPEESVLLNNGEQEVTDTCQYSEPLLLPSQDAASLCLEKKPCSRKESEENANKSHQWNIKAMSGEDRLHLVSEIKDTCTGGCPVDLCSVWWEFSGSDDLCIVSASEFSVCLWRPQEDCKWKCVHTWSFTEMPVIQILPLSQEKNVVCITLGNLDIMEIWALSSHPGLNTWEKQLVKRGHTKTAQGLSRRRVVSSSGGGDSQVVELWQLSENGCVTGSHTLAAPKDSIVAFSEVDGERDALVGSTVDNNLVLWNSVTGHLLKTFHIGNLCSDLTCISATSDSGLLFFIIGSLFSKPCEMPGSCIFRLIATNPQGGASDFITAYTLPEGHSSRYLEGDVKKQRAAAVLTCGSIALWDLPRSHCSAVLPSDSNTPWCLVRWANRPSCLLAGRKDGTICVFEYSDYSEHAEMFRI
ncbi:partner and localizer of BRCA2 isoform X2 [Hyla sarda]|uniref:partner and localizer of BRCA2 isoform X2 n=1 Tax=Hyla sarda TaxID=327740 RepID=UPI0024C42542|nr:partner and localizer of BRCA2 isoform X2 [Hyla sarda]